jgi:hypothetical protein
MTPEALIFASVAARLAAGTYQPRAARQPSHVPARLVRRARAAALVEAARELLAPALSCAAVAAAFLAFITR